MGRNLFHALIADFGPPLLMVTFIGVALATCSGETTPRVGYENCHLAFNNSPYYEVHRCQWDKEVCYIGTGGRVACFLLP